MSVPFPSTANMGVFMLSFLHQVPFCPVFAHPVLTCVTFVKFHYLCGWRMGVVLLSRFLKVLEWGIVNCRMGFDGGGGENATSVRNRPERKSK